MNVRGDDDDADEPANDNAVIARLLGIDEWTLVSQIGGPWHAWQLQGSGMAGPPEREFIFIGRAGMSVILACDAQPAEVLVGQAVGSWPGPGAIVWSRDEPRASIALAPAWLPRLAEAVDSAYRAKQPLLIICRYCGEVTGPEFAVDDECCSSCASTYSGVVF